MFKKPEKICPLLKGECAEARCMFWTHLRGKHPQTGADIDMPDCAIRYLPVLMIENSAMQRQTGAAVESFRNEMSKANAVALTLASQHKHQHLGGGGGGVNCMQHTLTVEQLPGYSSPP